MGCCLDKPAGNDEAQGIEISQVPKNLKKVTWTSDKPINAVQLQAMRDEFWDTNPHYGGDAGVWATIKVALEQETIAATKTYLEAAEILIANSKLTAFYDTRGFLYNLPDYVVSDPTNLTR